MWFRVRIISSTVLFIQSLRKSIVLSQEQKMIKHRGKLIYEDSDQLRLLKAESFDVFGFLKTCWYVFVSFWLWFNLITTPFIILWPDVNDQTSSIYYYLWFNELVWLLDIVRKFFDKPKKNSHIDIYDHVVHYLKTTFLLDFASTLPQVASGMNYRFIPLKLLRLY